MWTEVYRDVEFSGYSVSSLSDSGVLAVGNISGSMRILKLDEYGKSVETISMYPTVSYCGIGAVVRSVLVQPYTGKVFSLTWTPSQGLCEGDTLFSCGPDGKIVGFVAVDVC